VADEIARERIGSVPVAIRTGIRAEDFAPIGSIIQAVRIVERMTRFVPQITHRFVGAFDRGGVVLLDLRQAGVSEIEGNPNEGSAIRAPPLVAQIDRWAKIESLCRQVLVQLVHEFFEQRSAYLQTNVGNALRQERVTFAFPVGGCLFHGAESGKQRTGFSPQPFAAPPIALGR